MRFRCLIGCLALLAISSFSIATAAPIALSGWNTDDIVGATETGIVSNGNVNGWNFYQQGLSGGSQGLPAANNGVLAPAAVTGTVFRLAPYAGNNTDIVNGSQSDTLTLSAHQYQSLQFLDVDGNGFPTTWNVTMHFAGGSSTTTSNFNDYDWTTGPPTNTNGTIAFTSYGLVTEGNLGNFYGGYLYAAEHDITLSPADQAKQLISITINNTNGGNLMFLAASGALIPEPASFALFGLGAIGLFVAVRRRKA